MCNCVVFISFLSIYFYLKLRTESSRALTEDDGGNQKLIFKQQNLNENLSHLQKYLEKYTN